MAVDTLILVATVAFVAFICLAIGYALSQARSNRDHIERIGPRPVSIDEALEVLQMFVDADEKARSLLHASALRRARGLLKRGYEN